MNHRFFYAAAFFVLLTSPVITFSIASASDLDKIFKILTAPSEKAKPDDKASSDKEPLKQLFNLFGQPKKSAKTDKQPKGQLSGVMKHINAGKQIETKTVELEQQLQKVFIKIRAYQAMNGAIWVSLGKNYNTLVKDLGAFSTKSATCARDFIRHTKRKKNQQMELVSQVSLDTSAGVSDTTETISLNHKKNQNLRKAVKHFIKNNQLVGVAFEGAISDQNKSLDSLLAAYVQRLGQMTRHQLTASKIFKNISKEFQVAETEMRKAIDTFNEESLLITVKAAEHLDILYAQAQELRSVSNSAQGDLVSTVAVLGKIPGLLTEIQRLSGVFTRFGKVRKKLEQDSLQINKICEASRKEIYQSSRDIQIIGSTFKKMWAEQMATARKIAAERKVQVADLTKLLEKEHKKNQMLAARGAGIEEKQIKKMANDAFGAPVFN